MWTEAYHKQLSQGKSEEEAIRFSDRLVSRISGSGRKYDVAPILKGGDIERFLEYGVRQLAAEHGPG